MQSSNPVALALPRFGDSQTKLAAALGVSRQRVNAWLTGRNRVEPSFVLTFEKVTGIPRWIIRPDIYPPKDE